MWRLELRRVLLLWCGLGELWCQVYLGRSGERWVGACCGARGDEFLHLSVWKKKSVDCKCYALICCYLCCQTWGLETVVFLPLPWLRPRTRQGAGGAQSAAGAWAGLRSDARASAVPLAVASAGLGWLLAAVCPHPSICTPNVAPEVQAGSGERQSRCSMGYFTAP